jgi:hypothetical protein
LFTRATGEKRDSGFGKKSETGRGFGRSPVPGKEREFRNGSSGAETPSAAEKKTFRQDSGNEKKSQPKGLVDM